MDINFLVSILKKYCPRQVPDNSTVYGNEFFNLFRSLFNNYQKHEAVINALTQKAKGLTRDEIINSTEQVCLYHLPQIEQALGISGVQTSVSAWRSKSKIQ